MIYFYYFSLLSIFLLINMKNKFVTYKIASKLKEIGFDEDCIGYFHNYVEPSFVND